MRDGRRGYPGLDNGFGERLREARLVSGLTQAELAALVGRRSSWISQLETGRKIPLTRTARLFANPLGVTPGWLLLGTPAGALAEKEPCRSCNGTGWAKVVPRRWRRRG